MQVRAAARNLHGGASHRSSVVALLTDAINDFDLDVNGLLQRAGRGGGG